MKLPYDPMSLSIPVRANIIHGDLVLSHDSQAIVIFAHGSGSGRLSPRNRYVAEMLQQSGLATLLVDLLTIEEERIDRQTLNYRFDIPFLAERLVAVTDWVHDHRSFSHLRLGYFGASTGAAAALIAASERIPLIDAVVSRGGRVDLAGKALTRVAAPTLFIVGELDAEVLRLNQEAARVMKVPTKIEVVPEASHLFEELGALEQVSSLARNWFSSKLIQSHAA